MKKVHEGKEKATFAEPSGIVRATICKASGKKATSKCSDTYTEVFVEGMVPGECDAHSNSAQICSETGNIANEYCPNKITKYYSYVVEKERLNLWKNLSSSVQSKPTNYCTVHNEFNSGSSNTATGESKEPTITLNGELSITLNVGDSYDEKGATARDEADGDITSKIVVSGAVNTSKAGTYTVTYTVTNSNGKSVTASRTITVKAKETPVTTPEPKNETTHSGNTTNTTTNKNNTTKNENTVGGNTTSSNTSATNTSVNEN